MLNPLLYFIVKNYRFINDNQSARDNDNMIKSYYNTNTSFLNGYNITSKSMNATFENLLTTLNVQYYQNDNTSLYLCGLVMGTCSMLGSKSIDAVIEQCESMYSKEINLIIQNMTVKNYLIKSIKILEVIIIMKIS